MLARPRSRSPGPADTFDGPFTTGLTSNADTRALEGHQSHPRMLARGTANPARQRVVALLAHLPCRYQRISSPRMRRHSAPSRFRITPAAVVGSSAVARASPASVTTRCPRRRRPASSPRTRRSAAATIPAATGRRFSPVIGHRHSEEPAYGSRCVPSGTADFPRAAATPASDGTDRGWTAGRIGDIGTIGSPTIPLMSAGAKPTT